MKLEACVGLTKGTRTVGYHPVPQAGAWRLQALHEAGASGSLTSKQSGRQLACSMGGSHCVDLIWLSHCVDFIQLHIIVLWHAHAVGAATACRLVALLCSLAGCAQQPTSVWQQHGGSWTGHRLCVTALVRCRTLNALLYCSANVHRCLEQTAPTLPLSPRAVQPLVLPPRQPVVQVQCRTAWCAGAAAAPPPGSAPPWPLQAAAGRGWRPPLV